MTSETYAPAPQWVDHLSDIIKAYDIRGRMPGQWDADVARALGAAVARVLAGETGKLVVGHDMRPSSPELVVAFADGATSMGVDVVNIGLCSTDGLYFASGRLNLPGAMFTASHNPAEYNGIKLTRAGAKGVGRDTGLAEIHELTAELLTSGWSAQGVRGQVETRDMTAEYAGYLRELVDLSEGRALRVVVDAGNGMAGHTVPAVFGGAAGMLKLPVDVEPLYFELDGTFPNHEANPLDPKNLVDLQRAVVEHGADLGLAFDGDADRCFVVDEQGQPISPGAVTALVAKRELVKEQAAGRSGTVLHNAITSSIVPETVMACGGQAIRTKVGHSHIKNEMAATGAVFAGEHSAHYYFREFWGADTGLLAAMHLLAAVMEQDGPVSALLADYDPYFASGEINSQVSDAAAATAAVAEAIGGDGVRQDTLDGLTLLDEGGTWWVNVRPSNTEPLLRLNVEAHDQAQMEKLRDTALAAIRGTEEQAVIPSWLRNILVCPECRATLTDVSDDTGAPALRCDGADCGRTYDIVDGIPVLLPDLGEPEAH